MLARRVVPVQLLLDGRLVKTKGFAVPRDVGNPVTSSRVYYASGADELVFLNIARDKRTIAPVVKILAEVSQVLFVPLAAGGGVWSVKDARELVTAGADKVVVNTAVYHQPDLIRRIAEVLGSQAVVVSIDVRKRDDSWQCFSNCGRRAQDVPLVEHIEQCVAQGAGELLITSIDRDGMRGGYDLPLIALVLKHAGQVPVIACGGVGTYEHLKQGFLAGVDAGACGSLFSFGDNNPLRAKAYLRTNGIPCRH